MSAPAAALPAALPPYARVHTVWEVCQRIKGVLTHDELLADCWVKGEVSNVRPAASGHVYFTLKDAHAQLSCVAFDGASWLGFDLRDGLAVIVRGRVGHYEARGQTQLIADEVMPDGHGRLHLAYEQLKERLAAEGLFAQERKRALPQYPERIALVTSLQGAALRDMLRILAARWPLAEVVVRPVRVQGDGAAAEIAAAVRQVDRLRLAEVLIVGRGGGSIEDLWPFNEEAVARAVAEASIPVVSAVGHETDVTICDFAADLRAATPSNAAELVVPDADELAERLGQQGRRLQQRMEARLALCSQLLASLEQRAALRHPERLLEDWSQRLDEAAARLDEAQEHNLEAFEDRLGRAAALLDSYSPLRTLQRGYAIVAVEGKPATRTSQLPAGTRATVRVADGSVEVVVADG